MAKKDWEEKNAEAQRKAAEWLRGRQGPDDLAIACVYLALLLVIINLFAKAAWVGWLALALIVYAGFRIQSRTSAPAPARTPPSSRPSGRRAPGCRTRRPPLPRRSSSSTPSAPTAARRSACPAARAACA